ncbi:uncharacterized protein LOC133290607 [Gastrolobium bilobum]|uniref:uncharacterized protein LOC133290607 n=1 Tax=Gastrolobium bilobum TaxID=150636 RepID=UPI002AB03AA0|nr:uncharacterized protein LOC133290607 [Gastrolobium bilobum]
MAFITQNANYCYTMMPFGLKNAGATYQRMMNEVFRDLIGNCIEVYIDDMIAKSRTSEQHLIDLQGVFERLRKFNMRLNPSKCAFGVPAGKFLGFMLTERGIEVNPDKCKAVIEMRSPQTIKEVQQLTGRLVALTRFLANSAHKSLPLFSLLKKGTAFRWSEECENAFQEFKRALSCPPVLAKPDNGEMLYLYLAVGTKAISVALVKEAKEGQKPVYFISKVLQGAELRYQQVEKVALTLIFVARRLRPYFQCHPITVRTNQPIRQVLHKPDLAGRMMSWAIELSEYQITYEPRTAIKAQALTDFIAEMTQHSPPKNQAMVTPLSEVWKLYVDGSSNAKGSGAGMIIENLDGVAIEHSLSFDFNTTNNQAEYEAMIAGLIQAKEMGAQRLKVFSDSQLVTFQISCEYQAKGPLMCKYLEKVRELIEGFESVEVEHIRRTENTRADILSKLASTKSPGNKCSIVQQSMPNPCIVMNISETAPGATEETWITPIVNYLAEGAVPPDQKDARKIIRRSDHFCIVQGRLYKRGLSTPLLKCLNPRDVPYVLEEIHEGINGHHMGGHSLAKKALRAGFYWPTIERDAHEHVKKCEKCQKFADIHRAPPEELTSITSPWPFYKWGIDILGPSPMAAGRVQWLIVAIDYFTKWVEAEPLATITSQKARRFFWRSNIYRFGIPGEVITDNGTQFTDAKFCELMSSLHIRHHFAAVEHPQSNGLVESANKMLGKGIKNKLEAHKGAWIDNLDNVLWGYRATAQSSTIETPFRLTYDTEAMIPVEIGEPSWRREHVTEIDNTQNLKEALDLLDELRRSAAESDRHSKEKSATYYNKKVIPRSFQEKDLVLRRTDVGNKNAREGKLAPTWEGPYRIINKLGQGAYSLETLEGKALLRAWNADKLKKYYS